MKFLLPIALAAGLIGWTPAVQARINVVNLPGRDSVQLTIYNSVDLTLVKETRFLTFRKGLNRLEFSWANTLIDPTSVEFRALSHADAVEVLDVSFPPRVTNTLEWRINSEFSGEIQVEIRYFTSGISWSADYVAEAAKNEKLMNLAGHVRVNNNSGEDYDNAQIRLIVGTVKLVEEIAELARRDAERDKDQPKAMTAMLSKSKADKNQLYFRFAGAAGRADLADAIAPAEVIKEGLSEYFLYTVEGRDTIANGWSKRLPSFSTAEVPVTSHYKYERERWGDEVMRYYKFKNDKRSKLGKEPLPDGEVKAFRFISSDLLYAFTGRAQTKYIPINEEVELELGADQEVLIKPTLMNWEKTDLRFDNAGNVTGWTIKESWTIEVQNSKEIDVTLDIRRNFEGDWALKTTEKNEKVDATKVKFVLGLKSREKKTVTYELTMRRGTSATR